MQCVRTYITSCVITLHRRPEKTERKCVRKRQEREKKQGTDKEREKTGTCRTGTGVAVRTTARKKRKNCNYAELGASCFCPPLMCPFVTGGGFLFTGIIRSCNPLGRHTGAWFSRQILFYVDLYLCVVGRFAC